MGDAKFQNEFGPKLTHQLPIVRKQVDAGFYTLNRVVKFADNLSKSQAKFAKETKELANHEQKKRSALDNDATVGIVKSFAHVQTTTESIADLFATCSVNTDANVVKPINSFVKNTEKKKAATTKSADKLETATNKLYASVKKDQDAALKEWAALQKTRQEAMKAAEKKNDPKGAKVYDKAQKAHVKQKDKTAKGFKKVEDQMTKWNSEKRQLERADMEKILGEFEEVEVARINQTRESLRALASQLKDLVSPLQKLIDDLEASADAIDGNSEIDKFVTTTINEQGALKDFEKFKLRLPTSSSVVERDDEKLKWLLIENVEDSIAKYEAEMNPPEDAKSEATAVISNAAEKVSAAAAPGIAAASDAAKQLATSSGRVFKKPEIVHDESPMSSAPPTPDFKPAPPGDEPEVPAEPQPPAEEEGKDGDDEYAVALFDFASDDTEDLQLTEGDVVCVLAKDGDWWRGCKVTNGEWSKEGVFPKDFVGPYEP